MKVYRTGKINLFKTAEQVGKDKIYETNLTSGDIILNLGNKPDLIEKLLPIEKLNEPIGSVFVVYEGNTDLAENIYNYLSNKKQIGSAIFVYNKPKKVGQYMTMKELIPAKIYNKEAVEEGEQPFIHTLNKEPSLSDFYNSNLRPGKKIMESLMYMHGKEGDASKSYGLSSKLGQYLIAPKFLPKAVLVNLEDIYDIKDFANKKFDEISNMLNSKYLVIKPAFGQESGGYSVGVAKNKNRFAKALESFVLYAQENDLPPIALVQAYMEPLFAKKDDKFVSFFIRVHPGEECSLVSAKISAYGTSPKKIIKGHLDNRKEFDLSSGATAFQSFCLYNDGRVEELFRGSKKGIETIDLKDSIVIYEGREMKFEDFLKEIEPHSVNIVQEMENNINNIKTKRVGYIKNIRSKLKGQQIVSVDKFIK